MKRSWIKDTFIEALVGALAMGLVEMLGWTLRKLWKRRKKKRKEQDDGQD